MDDDHIQELEVADNIGPAPDDRFGEYVEGR